MDNSKIDREKVLKKYKRHPRCIFCGRYDGVPFKDTIVCEECLEYIKKKF